nr:TIGR03943 family protein [uncultured Desulfobulbus sp.]
MTTRLIHAAVMFLWAASFLWLFFVNQALLARLLHPKLWWLVISGAVILLLFSVVTLRRLRASHHIGPLRWTWPSIVIMLVPLWYFWPLQSAQLDSHAFFKRTTRENIHPSTVLESVSKTPVVTATNGPAFVTSLGQLVLDPEQFIGKKAEIICQAMKSDQLPPNQFICYRYRITCCAADAMPVYAFVHLKQTASPPAQDDWGRVQGTLSVHKIDNLSFPLIQDATFTSEKPPSFPYIY